MDLTRPPPVSGSGRTLVLGGSGLFWPALPSAAAGHFLIRHGPTKGPHWHALARRCGQRRIRLAVHHESRQNRLDRFLPSGVARHGRTGTGGRQARRHWSRFMKFSNLFHPAPRPWTARRVRSTEPGCASSSSMTPQCGPCTGRLSVGGGLRVPRCFRRQ